MFLNHDDQRIRIKLSASATTQLPWVACYADLGATLTLGVDNGTTNDTTVVDLVSGDSGKERSVKSLYVSNPNSGTATCIFEYYDGTDTRELFRVDLAENHSFRWSDTGGGSRLTEAGAEE